MNETEQTVTETELHAFADGFLTDADRARVEAWLVDHPDEAAAVNRWQAQNAGIKSLFGPFEKGGPMDGAMIAAAVPAQAPSIYPKRLTMAAVIAAVFVAGLAVGHFLLPLADPPALQLEAMETLPRQAQSAFLVYASEVRHPVEVGANEEPHLATWLGKRLNIADLKVPNLQTLGFQLVGGRLLPINDTPGAMFMYEDATGKRLTVLVGRNKDNQTTSFRFATAGAVDTFYWIDGDLGYAVTGEISRDTLRQVAEQCYKQFPS